MSENLFPSRGKESTMPYDPRRQSAPAFAGLVVNLLRGSCKTVSVCLPPTYTQQNDRTLALLAFQMSFLCLTNHEIGERFAVTARDTPPFSLFVTRTTVAKH